MAVKAFSNLLASTISRELGFYLLGVLDKQLLTGGGGGGGVKIDLSLSETKSVNHAIKKFKAD